MTSPYSNKPKPRKPAGDSPYGKRSGGEGDKPRTPREDREGRPARSDERRPPRRDDRGDQSARGDRPARGSRDERPARSGDRRPPARDDGKPRTTRRPEEGSPRRDDGIKVWKAPAKSGDRDGSSPRQRRDGAAPRRSEGKSGGRPEGRPAGKRMERDSAPADASQHKGSFDPRTEARIHGLNTCVAVARERREDIIRAYFTEEMAPKFGALMKQLAAQKRAYRVVPPGDLEKITDTTHHGGVCFIVRRPEPMALETLLAKIEKEPRVCLLILEGVGNPHNIGAVVRSCANFGTPALLVADAGLIQAGSAQRTAEGGAEYVAAVEYGDLAATLLRLREAGFTIAATSSHQGADLYRLELPAKVAVLFGEETMGLSAQAQKQAELSLKVPGTGKVESLNVSVASSLVLGEFWRQGQLPRRPAKG